MSFKFRILLCLMMFSQVAFSQVKRSYCENFLNARTLVDLPYSLNRNGFDDQRSICDLEVSSADKTKHNLCDYKNFNEPGPGMSRSIVNGVVKFSTSQKGESENYLATQYEVTVTPKDKNNQSLVTVKTRGGTRNKPEIKNKKALKYAESDFSVAASNYSEETTYVLNGDCKIQSVTSSSSSDKIKFNGKISELSKEKYTLSVANCKSLDNYVLNLKKMEAEVSAQIKKQSAANINPMTYEARMEIKEIEKKYSSLIYPASDKFKQLGFYTHYEQEPNLPDNSESYTQFLWKNIYDGCAALANELAAPSEQTSPPEERKSKEKLVIPGSKI